MIRKCVNSCICLRVLVWAAAAALLPVPWAASGQQPEPKPAKGSADFSATTIATTTFTVHGTLVATTGQAETAIAGKVTTVEVAVAPAPDGAGVKYRAIKKGEVLVRLNDDDARARLDVAKATLAIARAGLKKYQDAKAADAGLVSRADLDRARGDVESAEAGCTQATRDLEATRILAPIDGTVIEVDVSPGDQVTAGQTLLTMRSDGPLCVPIRVPPAVAGRLEKGTAVSIEVGDGPTRQSFAGKIAGLVPQSKNETDQSVTVMLDAKHGELSEGMSADVRLRLSK